MEHKNVSSDEEEEISQKLQLITTLDPNLNRSKEETREATRAEEMKEQERLMKERLDRDFPGENLPEKIVFVVDIAKENDCTPFESRSGDKYDPLEMIKRVVKIFVSTKSSISEKHEFALVGLKSSGAANWLCNFTDEPKAFLACLAKLTDDPLSDEQETCNLEACFQKIEDQLHKLPWQQPRTFVVRTIFIYARSCCLPVFRTGSCAFDRLIRTPNFYLDAFYVHEPLGDDRRCAQVYGVINDAIDPLATSYILEVGRSLHVLHSNMAKLLAHPLQRVRQTDSPYTLKLPPPQELQTNV